jgi:DNA polymerase I-like protein with 3'-5' exonuclease and polymerase domains/uracil-DNA glycosylase
MLVGEGPGSVELSHKRPFVGPAGRLLDALLKTAGVDRETCWVTNATLGLPPRYEDNEVKTPGKGGLHDRFPMAIYSCLPRLEAEIKAAQPRVIVALGPGALIALTGHEEHKTRLIQNPCNDVNCDPENRKYRQPCLVCANGSCSWYGLLTSTDPKAEAEALKAQHGGACPACGQAISRLQPRAMKCPTCGGKKRREEAYTTFGARYSLVGREGVAGAVFDTASLPSRLDEFGVKYLVPTYHPSYCLRSAKEAGKYIAGQYAARACVDHLAKAHALTKRDVRFQAAAKLTKSPLEVRAWFAGADRDVAVDIETNAMGGPWSCSKITVIGFACASQPEALVVDTRDLPADWNTPSPLLDEIHGFLADPGRGKVFHNGTFDRLVILRLWGIDVEGVVGDTLLEHHALYPDEEQGLGFCAHELLDAPAWKGGSHKIADGTEDDLSGYESLEDLALYNARDTRATALLDEIMRGPKGSRGRLATEHLERVHDLDLAMQGIAVRMEHAGLPISKARFAEIESSCLKVMDAELSEMRSLVGLPDFTPRGPQLAEVLFDPAGPIRLPVTERTATGQPSASKEVLARMSDRHPFVQHLLRWRKYEYALSHYVRGAGLEPGPDGRIHPQWKVHGTVTGRWSSSPNFQNWPKGDGVDQATNLRSAIVAPAGRVIVGADYSQLEMRIMASLSGDPDLIRRCMNADESDKLNPEADPHSYVASMTFGRTFLDADKPARKALRDVAKRVVYGLNYGAGAATILAAIYDGGYSGPPLTTRLVEATVAAYFQAFPGVPRWRDQQLQTVQHAREVRSPILGRRRIFPLGEIDATVAYNFPIQSGAADLVSLRLVELDRRLADADPSAVLLAQVHDAVYVECSEDRVSAVERVVEESLTLERTLVEGSQPMLYCASASHARSWDKAA